MDRLTSRASVARCKPAKRVLGGDVSVTSLIIKLTKWWKRERMKLAQLELHTFPSWGVFLFYTQFLLDYKEDNLVIFGVKISLSLLRTNSPLLRIYIFETYEIWILGDMWINILRVIPSLIYLSITNFSYEVGWPAGGLGIPDGV